jgi:hypothetical protein
MSIASKLQNGSKLTVSESFAVLAAIADAPAGMSEVLFGVDLDDLLDATDFCPNAVIATQYGVAIRAGIGNERITSAICSVVAQAAILIDSDQVDVDQMTATGAQRLMARTLGQSCLPDPGKFVAALVVADDSIPASDAAQLVSGIRAAMLVAGAAFKVQGVVDATSDEFVESFNDALQFIGFDLGSESSNIAGLIAAPSEELAAQIVKSTAMVAV